MFEPTIFKLGRAFGIRHDALPKYGDFLNSISLPALNEKQDWYSGIPADGWPMLRNNFCGNCTIACVGHIDQQESVYAGTPAALMTDDEALGQYEALSHFNPMDPKTDTGLYEGDVGRHWLTNGFMVGGVKDQIAGFSDCDVRNLTEVKYAIQLTANSMLGVMLPRICEQKLDLWDVPTNRDDAELIGAHCIPAVGFDRDHWFVVTWGTLVPCTNAWIAKYLLEAHATLSKRWMSAGKAVSPSGVSWDFLVAATRKFSTAIAA